MYCHEMVILNIQSKLEALYPSLSEKPKCIAWRYGRVNNIITPQEYNAARKYYNKLGLWYIRKEG